jgi:hypothetical protein
MVKMMFNVSLTNHPEKRMQQRGFRKHDISLFLNIATRVADDAYFLTKQDAARAIEQRKKEIQQIERLRGSKFIVEGDVFITLYHTDKMSRQSRNKKVAGNHDY